MLVSPMGGDKQRVTLIIMQDDQSTTPQNFSRASDQPTWDQRISIDGLAVPIDIEDGHGILSSLCAFLPQRSAPTGENFCERSIRSNRGQLCQKSLGVAVAVGEASTGQQCQSLTGVALPR